MELSTAYPIDFPRTSLAADVVWLNHQFDLAHACATERDAQRDQIAALTAQIHDADTVIASARETLATNQALSARLDYALKETEVLNRVRTNLKSAGLSSSAPDLVVNELIDKVRNLEDAARAMSTKTRTDDLPARTALKQALYHIDLVLDALEVPTRDEDGAMCTDGRIYWLAKKAGIDMRSMPPHLMEFHRLVNTGRNPIHNVITELETIVAKLNGPKGTEPKTASKFALGAKRAA